jgi:hypothetical protein
MATRAVLIEMDGDAEVENALVQGAGPVALELGEGKILGESRNGREQNEQNGAAHWFDCNACRNVRLFRTPADDRLAGRRASSTFVVRVMCGALITVSGSGIDLGRDRYHRFDELIEFALRLSFGRLDHQGAVHDERKADSLRMKAVVDEALGPVAGADASLNTTSCMFGRSQGR